MTCSVMLVTKRARPSQPDPVTISHKLWEGFTGQEGWDVGANCGQTILEMAFPFHHVTAFEPSPDSFAVAQEVVSQHRLRAEVLNVAISSEDGYLTLAYPAREQRETGQLVTIGTKGMEWEPEDWEATEKVTVPCVRADTAAEGLGMPDFMKVDTEGHEVHVLAGAHRILSEGRTDFLIEFHTPQNQEACQALLEQYDCLVELVRHPNYEPGSAMWHQHGWLRALAPHRKRSPAGTIPRE